MGRLILCLALCGCATQYSRRQQPGDDPANPEAPAAAVRTVALYETPAVDAGARGAQGEYGCPMHPEVHQAQPGRCPSCGMNLEKKGAP